MVDWAAEVVVAKKEEVVDMLREGWALKEETAEEKEGRGMLSSLDLEAGPVSTDEEDRSESLVVVSRGVWTD